MPTIGNEFNPYGLFHGLFIPNCIAQSTYLSDQEKLLMGRLYQYAGRNGKAFPKRTVLAQELAWNLRKLDRNIQALKNKGLIKTTQADATAPSVYWFLWHKIYTSEFPELVSEDDCTVVQDSGGTVKNDSTIQKGQLQKGQSDSKESPARKNPVQKGVFLPRNKEIPGKKEKEKRETLKLFRKIQPETIELIEYWNNHDVFTKHSLKRRRTVAPYHEQTRTVQDIDDAVKRLLKGTYYSKSNDLKEMLRNKSFTVPIIKKAIDRMAVANTPEYSRKPRKIGFMAFIENQHAKLCKDKRIEYRYKFPLIHFTYNEPARLEDNHKERSTPYSLIVDKVIDLMSDGKVQGTKYNKVVTSVEKAIAMIDRRANGNKMELRRMLPSLLYDAMITSGKKLTVDNLPLGVYRLEGLLEERLMFTHS